MAEWFDRPSTTTGYQKPVDWREVADKRADTIESLREQLEVFREDAEEARKVRGVLSLAAPAGYAVAHVKRLQADLEAAETKLAEDAHRNDQLKRERDKYRAKLAEAELTVEDWKRKCDNVHEGRDRLRAKLAEVEKGLDAALEQVEDERARVMKVEKERDGLRVQVHLVHGPPVGMSDYRIEAVAKAIYGALEDSYSIERETTEAPTKAELEVAAVAAIAAMPKAFSGTPVGAVRREVQYFDAKGHRVGGERVSLEVK